MSRRRSKNGASIPAPNDDVTMPIGAKMLTEAVFRETSLDAFLDALKRDRAPASRPRRWHSWPTRWR